MVNFDAALLNKLPQKRFRDKTAYRLVNSKFPPIAIFDDVADNDEFEALFRLQAKTNPRLLDEVGHIRLVQPERRPFGIAGCNYALAPFTHINRLGSRFSRGEFGVLYAADAMHTALAETHYHQQRYFQTQVQGLKYDRIVMRGLKLKFSAMLFNICSPKIEQYGWYDANDYAAAQQLGDTIKQTDKDGLWYDSVRKPGTSCYALFSPHLIKSVVQTQHYEFVWNGQRIDAVLELSGSGGALN
ncbi:MAG TPA: RES family NAD+ phosphorylase [Spongiibacteraceae bacterium]|nr:RES family NAD+ phosphorylase [Spongiibacteraceae bacterium]